MGACCAGGAGCTLCASVTFVAFVAFVALRALNTLDALDALLSLDALFAGNTLDALFTFVALRALRADDFSQIKSRHDLSSLHLKNQMSIRIDGIVRPLVAGIGALQNAVIRNVEGYISGSLNRHACDTLRAGRALRALDALLPLFTFRPLDSLNALRPSCTGFTLRACFAGFALFTLNTLDALNTLFTFGANITLNAPFTLKAGNALRACRANQTPRATEGLKLFLGKIIVRKGITLQTSWALLTLRAAQSFQLRFGKVVICERTSLFSLWASRANRALRARASCGAGEASRTGCTCFALVAFVAFRASYISNQGLYFCHIFTPCQSDHMAYSVVVLVVFALTLPPSTRSDSVKLAL